MVVLFLLIYQLQGVTKKIPFQYWQAFWKGKFFQTHPACWGVKVLCRWPNVQFAPRDTWCSFSTNQKAEFYRKTGKQHFMLLALYPLNLDLSKCFDANEIGYLIFDKCYILLMLKLPKLLTFKCEKDFRFHLLNCNQGFIVKEKIYENWNIGSDVYQNAKSPAKAKK